MNVSNIPSDPLVLRRSSLLAVGLVLLVYAALAFGIYNGLTKQQLGANDFYSRWMACVRCCCADRILYADAVTREIQIGMYGRLARPEEDQVAFAYPLYAAYLAAPFLLFPYDVTQALWMALLVMLVAGGTLALSKVNRIRLTPLALTAILLCALFFYPSVRGIFLGNYTLVSFAMIAFSILAVARGQDAAAGIFLALASVKPQPVVFLLPVILFWAWWNGRRRVVWSALIALAVLIGSSFVLLPSWFSDFYGGLRNYADYLPIGPPAETFWKLLVPQFANELTLITSAVLFGWMIVMVWRRRKQEWVDFQITLGFVALVTTMTAVRIGSPDQMLLLILWLAWLGAWCTQGKNVAQRKYVALGSCVVFLMIAPWYFFLTTLEGNQEALVVSTILPWFTLGVFCVGAVIGNRLQSAKGDLIV